MKPFGIRKKMLLVALIPILTMTVLLEVYVVYSRFSDLESALLERSKMLVHQLASASEYAVFSNNTALLQQYVDAALTQNDVSNVVIQDESSKTLMRGTRGKPQYEIPLKKVNSLTPFYQDDNVLILYEPITPTQIKPNDLDRENGLISATTLVKPLGAVFIEISKQRLISQKQQVLILSLVISLMILTTALMLALWAARRITRPIIGMSKVMRSFGEGNLDTRILRQPNVIELDELSSGFNEMANRLQHHREILETRVKERTAALVISEQESRTLIENSPDIIARYDSDLRISYVNPALAATTEGGVSSLLGKKLSEFHDGINSEIYEAKIKEVFATGDNTRFELKWTDKGGKEICSSIRLTAERDVSGTLTSVLAVGHDITELNESKEEINRKELAKSRFLAAAGHDLRQPLAAANLFIHALKFANSTDEQNRIIQRLDQCMFSFSELLESLLNVSKLDAGIVRPVCTRINVIVIFIWLEQSFVTLAQEKQLDLKLYFPMNDPLAIYSDINLIKSVLMNLVSNAIKYTSKGTILVSARRRGGEVSFQVWDTGTGIKQEHLEHIFDEFYQVDNQNRDRKEGLGLGLAISKRSISLLGSKITCRSEFGRGSVFEFRLPSDESQPDSEPPPGIESIPENIDLGSMIRGKRFTVVEDDTMVAEAMCNSLTTMGGTVECFNNGEDTLRSVNIGCCDYYIVDYMLAGKLNGIHVLNQLRQKLNAPIKAVLMTGDTSPSFIRQAEGFDLPVLYKPVNISKLISILCSLKK